MADKLIKIDESMVEDVIKETLNEKECQNLSQHQQGQLSILLRNAFDEHFRSLNEGTVSSDISQFTPIIAPLVRRVYPTLIANEILGVQTMSMPTGYIYALVNRYTGDGKDNRIMPIGKGMIVKISEPTDKNPGDTVLTDAVIKYKENLFLLLQVGDTQVNVGDFLEGSSGAKVTEVYTNEASFLKILKNYTGPYTTAAAERLSTDMKEIGFSIEKKAIEAQSRALKGQYTVEMFQDLQSQHGLLADVEIMNLLEYELSAEIDRECVDSVNKWATQLPDTVFSDNIVTGGGRWEIEKYRVQTVRIAKESTIIGVETKRGHGNILLVSPKVATMLEQVGSFKAAPVLSGVTQPVSGGVAGLFDGKYKVIVDQYASSDYCTVLYKGATNKDAIGFFAPYIPLSFTRTTNQDSGQPSIIAKMRYGLTAIPGVASAESLDRANTYARSFGIDFRNTALA